MKTIDIQINQAKIESFGVTLNSDGRVPDVNATIALLSGTKQISTFSLHTQKYYSSGVPFDLPVNMIEPIVDIAKQLEVILVAECNRQLKQLPKSDAIDAETASGHEEER